MFIKNDNISLRVAEPYDADTIFRWENDIEIWRVSETIVPLSLHQIQQFLLRNNDLMTEKQIRLMIDKNDDHSTIGCIDIYDYDSFNSRAGIGILIDKEYREKGYAKQTISMIMEYCFNILLLNQLYVYTLSDNIQSNQLFTSLGFERCGLRKQWFKTAKGFVDQIEYQYFNKKKNE